MSRLRPSVDGRAVETAESCFSDAGRFTISRELRIGTRDDNMRLHDVTFLARIDDGETRIDGCARKPRT